MSGTPPLTGTRTGPIAVVSVGALFPGAASTHAFWRDIVEGRDRLSEVPRTHWLASDYFDPRPDIPDKVYTTRGGFLSEVEFSPVEFGLPPSTLPAIDTAQLLALTVAKRVLAEAGGGRYATMDRSRVSVILGVASATELVAHMAGRLQIPVMEAAMRAAGIPAADAARVRAGLEACYVGWQEGTFPGMLGNVVAGRIANRLDLGGTNAVVDAACASSLAAVDMAVQQLSLGVADLVITGGVDALNDVLMFMCFAQTGALSRSGDCRPFSQDADGTMLGEGIGLFALRRLEDAERDGDQVHAVIRGVGSSSDGRATSIYAPLATGQVQALERAYARAEVSPATIGLVEGHGTGTVAGDAAEIEALRAVYERAGARRQGTAIGSVKGQIGHTKAAAGAAGLAKAVLALRHKVLPPTVKVSRPIAALADVASPIYLNTKLRPWIHGARHPRRAAVSALGFGGTNFHVVLEEYCGAAPPPSSLRVLPSELIVLGAADATALANRCRVEAARVTAGALAHVAKAAQAAFDPSSPIRVAVVADGEKEAADRLIRAAEALERGRPGAPGISFGEGAAAGPVAVLFPGQGSQSVGMAGDLAAHFDEVRRVWDGAACLEPFADEGLHDRVFPPPVFDAAAAERQSHALTETEWAQPALACASLSIWRLVSRLGLVPIAFGGHSLGELSALAAAGAFDDMTAIRVARARGQWMAQASRQGEGAMTAVALDEDDERLGALLASSAGAVTVAASNAPQQVVLSGAREAIEKFERSLAAEAVSWHRLAVATAFHSSMVHDACAPFRTALQDVVLAPLRCPAYSNVTAAPYPTAPDAMRDLLAAAVAQPVRFRAQVEAMYAAGARTFVEVGPGQVLTRLVDRCLEGRPHLAVSLDAAGRHGVTALFQALGRLAAAGVALDFQPLWVGHALDEDPATRPAARLSVRLSGANFGKPYPLAAEDALARARGDDPAAPAPSPTAPPATSPSAAPPATDLQASLIAAQMEYERTMAESHAAFLRTIEASYGTSGTPLTAEGAVMTPPPPMRIVDPSPVVVVASDVTRAPAVPTAMTPLAAPAPGPAAPPDLLPLIVAVIAEQTGYPAEMIEPHMDLESDLGIDSIKRVEILAVLNERSPGLREVTAGDLPQLRTIEKIVRFLDEAETGRDALRVEPRRPGEKPTAPPDAATAGGAPDADDLARFVVLGRPCAAPALATPGLFSGPLTIVPDDGGVAAALRAKLQSQGIRAEVRDTVPDDARSVIFLRGLAPVDASTGMQVQREAFEIARRLATRARAGEALLVTVQDTGGDLGFSGAGGARAWAGGLAALAKTAAMEWPESCARAIDVECGGRSDNEVAEALARELFEGGGEREVGLRATGARSVPQAVATPRERPAAVTADSGVVVVSGGARGVTAECLLALAAVARARFVLLGRTGLEEEPSHFHGLTADAELKRAALEAAPRRGGSASPGDVGREVARVLAVREVRETLARLQRLGIEARYDTVDVRDARALRSLLDEVRQAWGPVRGLVHAAGVLGDARLEQRTDATQFDRVFTTKVAGLAALLDATRDDDLAWIALFSSVAARAGNAGQADYAMANETLNKVAAAEAVRRRGTCRVVSLGWGPWEGGMVTPSLRRHFTARGVDLIPLERGARAFVGEILSPGRAVEVLLGKVDAVPGAGGGRGELRIDASRMPHLADHRIKDTVVVPLALAIEWLARLVPTDAAAPIVLRDVHVRRGLLLPAFADGGDIVRVLATSSPTGVTSLELRDAEGRVRVTCRLEDGAPAPPPMPRAASSGRSLCSADLYGPERLFHGPRFQVLEAVDSLSADEGHATVKGTRAAGWIDGPWRSDPAALDGALQLAILVNMEAGMGPTLPLRVGEVVLHKAAGEGSMRCVTRVRERAAERATVDAWLVGHDGTAVAELHQIQLWRAPSGFQAE